MTLPPAWSELQCLEGTLRVSGLDQPLLVTRSVGEGHLSFYPQSAPARIISGSSVELMLKKRSNFHDMHKPRRNGGRVYLSEHCIEGTYARSGYAAFTLADLLGKTIALTVDLSAATCGCATSFKLVPMRQNVNPGICAGDYYCDAASTCDVACAELVLFEANQHAFKTSISSAGDTGLGACLCPQRHTAHLTESHVSGRKWYWRQVERIQF